ncbi:MAG: hypothetical protein QG665_36 [Patescibacteria group bacterium]|nr:hypothetical protein [Patescibacteria group bacterium]
METIFIIAATLLGLAAGSFLNVVVLRYNTGMTLKGRSMCLSCRRQLTWPELVPVWSFVKQKGRCRGCDSKISAQYIAVEVVTALVFLAIAILASSVYTAGEYFQEIRYVLWGGIVASTLLVIAVYDLRHKIIPDELAYIFMAVATLSIFVVHLNVGLRELIWVLHGLYSGAILFGIFWAIWHFSDGRLMGFGDAKLVFGIGLWLGLKASLIALLIAFVVGAMVGLILIALKNHKNLPHYLRVYTLKSELPFAPFLALGAIVSFILLGYATPIAF